MNKYLIIIGLFLFSTSCTQKTFLSSGTIERTEIDQSISIDETSAITETITPYREELDAQMNEVIGYLEHDLQKDKINGTLGLFAADAVLSAVNKKYDLNADFCILNHGGLRISELTKGDIILSEMYELMPFDNTVSIMLMKGSVLQAMADRIADYGGWPISAGLELTIQDRKAIDVKVHGEPLDVNKTYTMITNSYIADGGDNSDFLIGVPKTSKGYMVRDAMIDYVREKTANNEKINQKAERRIIKK